jgi:hypothetical protein
MNPHLTTHCSEVQNSVFAAPCEFDHYASGIRTQEEIMELGAFSVSLTVKDIETSKLFYEKLGFTVFRRKSIAELADYEKWRPRHWAISRNV